MTSFFTFQDYRVNVKALPLPMKSIPKSSFLRYNSQQHQDYCSVLSYLPLLLGRHAAKIILVTANWEDLLLMVTNYQETSTSPPSGRRLALVVGVNGQPAPGRATLQYAVNDGQNMTQVLQQDYCGFELFRPPLLGDQATTSQVRDAVLDLAEHLQDDDLALFYFSGHAEAMLVEADLDDVYLVTHDFNTARVKRDKDAYLSLRWLRRILFEHDKASNILLILDCCYAGKFSDSAPDHYLDELQQRLRYYFAEPNSAESISSRCKPSSHSHRSQYRKRTEWTWATDRSYPNCIERQRWSSQ